MFGAGSNSAAETVYLIREYTIELILSVIAVLPLKNVLLSKLDGKKKLQLPAQIALCVLSLAIFAFSYMKLVSGSFMPFIYFQF